MKKQNDNNSAIEVITLGGGCFWCMEAVYQGLNGILSVASGFSGGDSINPTYEEVVTGNSKHVEVVQMTFDKTKISLYDILKMFFDMHDPTSLNKQGSDVGTQYRSVIFFRSESQKKIAQDSIAQLQQEKIYEKPIVTTLEPFDTFYKAEDYHQNYYQLNKDNNLYCQLVIRPKIEKFEKIWKNYRS